MLKERKALQGQNISQSNHNCNNDHHCYADIVARRPTFSRSSSSHKQFAHTRGAAAIVFVFRSLIGTSPPPSAWFCSRTDPVIVRRQDLHLGETLETVLCVQPVLVR